MRGAWRKGDRPGHRRDVDLGLRGRERLQGQPIELLLAGDLEAQWQSGDHAPQLLGDLGVLLGELIHDGWAFWNLVRQQELGESLGARNPVQKGIYSHLALFAGKAGEKLDIVVEAGRRSVGRASPQVRIPAGVGEIKFGVQAVRGGIGSPIVG